MTQNLSLRIVDAQRASKGRIRSSGRWAHLPLIITCLALIFPFYWSIVMASGTIKDFYAYPPKLLPGTHLLQNIQHVLTSINFFGSLLNTTIVALSTTVLVLAIDSLAAFTFAKYVFPGSKTLFRLLLLFLMLPAQLSTVPQFITMVHLGLIGTLPALIIPAAANAFGIFWLRQYVGNAVPDELLDAATLDGCGFFRQYWSVILPLIRPGLAFLGIYTFTGAWNDYVWPLIVLVNPNNVTLQVALAQLNVNLATNYSVVMAGALMSVIPLLVVFLIFSKQFVADSIAGAVRG